MAYDRRAGSKSLASAAARRGCQRLRQPARHGRGVGRRSRSPYPLGRRWGSHGCGRVGPPTRRSATRPWRVDIPPAVSGRWCAPLASTTVLETAPGKAAPAPVEIAWDGMQPDRYCGLAVAGPALRPRSSLRARCAPGRAACGAPPPAQPRRPSMEQPPPVAALPLAFVPCRCLQPSKRMTKAAHCVP